MASDDTADDPLSRRKMLALTISGTAVSLAGCSGGGNDTTTGGGGTTSSNTATSSKAGTSSVSSSSTITTSSSNSSTPTSSTSAGGTTETPEGTGQNATQSGMASENMADDTLDKPINYVPTDANWNHYSPQAAFTSFWTWDYVFNTFWNGNTDWWLLKEDGFSYDADTKTVTYEFKPEYSYWWNGDHVTAEDYQIQREIERLEDPDGSKWKSWTLDDKYTLKGKRKKKINPINLAEGGKQLLDYRGHSREWLEKLKDDTTQDARQATLKGLQGAKISTEEFAKKGLGNSVYRPTDWSTTQLVWETFDDHPLADNVSIPKVRFNVASGGASTNQMITHDKIDFAPSPFPSELRNASKDYLKTLYRNRSIQARNLLFNYNSKHVGRRNVRRALMSILDFTRLKDFWNGKGGFVKQYQTGLPKSLEDKWLGDELMNQMYKYPLKSDPKQAKMFLKRGGYSKEGDTWVDSDGDPLHFSLLIAAPALGKALSQTWNQWGADVKLLAVEGSQWYQKALEPSQDWGVTLFLHGFDRLTPLNYFDTVSPYNMRLGKSYSQIQTWLKNGKTNSEINGRPIKLTIPGSPGLEVNGDGKDINIYNLVEELRTTQSEDRSREIIRTLATYFNYDLPLFDMFPQVAGMWGDTKHFEWPDNDDIDTWQQKGSRATYATLRKGLVKPVSK